MLARVHTIEIVGLLRSLWCTRPLNGQREKEREREGKRKREREKRKRGEREIEREREYLFLKGMTGALAPFSYLVSK
jgi:hypothetical protein